MNSDICFIINARSGGEDGTAVARRVEDLMAGQPGRVAARVIRKGSRIGSETERALQGDFGTIVIGGGDGTISTVASRLAGSGRRLGILPLGTFNYVAREFGVPFALEDAIRVITDGGERLVDVREVNGRAFLNNAVLGAYVKIVRRRERQFAFWGRSRVAAYWVVLRSLFGLRKSLALNVTIDGEVWRHRTRMAFVAKGKYQLEQYNFAGAARVSQRQLALFVAPDCNRLELVRLAFGLALGRLDPERDIALHCGSDILVETSRRHRRVICDGEVERLEAPFRFSVRNHALCLIVPEPATWLPTTRTEPGISGTAMDQEAHV